MSEKEFLEKMVDILDAEEEFTLETKLEDIEEWDSLSAVGYIAMANTSCQKNINPDDIKKAEYIKDLYNLLK